MQSFLIPLKKEVPFGNGVGSYIYKRRQTRFMNRKSHKPPQLKTSGIPFPKGISLFFQFLVPKLFRLRVAEALHLVLLVFGVTALEEINL